MLTSGCVHTLSPSPQEKVSELAAEKEVLNEKLKAEEERRRHILGDKNLVRTPTSIMNHLLSLRLAAQTEHFEDCVNAVN